MGEVARLRGDLPTVLEHGAPGDSQSNGFVERAIRSVEDMVRTHKLALEEKIGEVLKVDTAAMAWLVEHCADILNKCQQGKDGRTPYERLRGKQFSGFMLEFGSQVMLRVMDKVSGGVMQERWVEGTWLGSRFTTLEHLVARKSDGVVVRTRAVRDLQKSPTAEDLVRIIGHPHAPQGVQRYRRLDVPRPETVPEPEEHRSAAAPDPSRPIPRAVYITRAMLERHGYSEGCQRCNAMRRGQTYGTGGHTADCRRRMEAALAQDEEYQFEVEQANFRKDQYLAEEVERSTKRRRQTVRAQRDTESATQGDQEMVMENHEAKEASSSGDTGRRSAERRKSSMQGGVKRKADDELLEEQEESSRTRSTEGGDELPIPGASSSVAPNTDGEVDMAGSKQTTQLKRPQDDEPAHEDQPPAHRARLEILCSFVHGNLDQGEDTRQEAKEIKQLIQAASGSLSLNILEEAASAEANPDATEWDNYWTPWWQKRGAEQIPPELTADQVLSAKKVEMRNIEERGVYEVVKREVMEQTPGATMLSVKWVLTNKGTPKAPVPKARLVASHGDSFPA